MNKFMKSPMIMGGVFVVLASAPVDAGVEETIALTDIPADIMAAAKEKLEGLRLSVDVLAPIDLDNVIDDNLNLAHEDLGEVTIVGANTETEDDGSFVYEIQGTTPDGRKVEIDLDPSARVEEIEIEFKFEDVPGAVIKSVAAKMPGFAPEFIEASHSASMQVIGYEFVGKMGEDTLDIEVSADGRFIAVSDQ